MSDDFNLSKQRAELRSTAFKTIADCLKAVEKQDKEFIRLLREELFEICVNKKHEDTLCLNDSVQDTIDKLAGEDLI